MSWNLHGTLAVEGNLAELVGMGYKHFIINLKKGGALHTHRGIIHHDDLIGKPWGSKVFSHLGNPFFLLQPSLADIIRDTPRITQIMYPKDIGFILITMGDMLGVPILPPYYSLRLLPYVVPQISTWKRRMLREKDLTDALA